MRVVVDALPVTNLSGRHVFIGHVSRLVAATCGDHEFFVLHHESNRDLKERLPDCIHWMECPAYTAHWVGRTAWERHSLDRLSARIEADLIMSFSGTAVSSGSLPEIAFASNPWSLVEGLERSPAEIVKGALQRWAYRAASRRADALIFASGFLRQAYRSNGGAEPSHSAVVYPGIDERTFEAAAALRRDRDRDPHRILAVSAMAPHKGVEVLVEALGVLRNQRGVPARLSLVGSWPDPRYEARVRELIRIRELSESVEITGHVSRSDLDRRYARAAVFCLMSRCESFGIPSVEAQAFGLPVVSSNCCAIPEVCGDGGMYPDPGDIEGVADALEELLTDPVRWNELSRRALANADRYHWETTTRPLPGIVEAVGARGRE